MGQDRIGQDRITWNAIAWDEKGYYRIGQNGIRLHEIGLDGMEQDEDCVGWCCIE